MTKKLILILTLTLATMANAQTMGEMFVSMPDSIMPLLTQTSKRDMLDFLANGMDARVHNQLGEEVTLKHLTDSYLFLEMSEKSRVEMKLLFTTDSIGILAFVRTVEGPGADSHVKFFDTEWRQLKWMELPHPSIEEFFSPAPDSIAEDTHYAQLSLADLCLIEVSASPDEPTFEITLNIDELAEKEKDAAICLVHPLLYFWDGATFRKKE